MMIHLNQNLWTPCSSHWINWTAKSKTYRQRISSDCSTLKQKASGPWSLTSWTSFQEGSAKQMDVLASYGFENLLRTCLLLSSEHACSARRQPHAECCDKAPHRCFGVTAPQPSQNLLVALLSTLQEDHQIESVSSLSRSMPGLQLMEFSCSN